MKEFVIVYRMKSGKSTEIREEYILITGKKQMRPDLSCGTLFVLFHARVGNTEIFFMQEEI